MDVLMVKMDRLAMFCPRFEYREFPICILQVGVELGEEGADADALMAKMDRLQTAIDAANGWEIDRMVQRATDALRCPPGQLLGPLAQTAAFFDVNRPHFGQHGRLPCLAAGTSTGWCCAPVQRATDALRCPRGVPQAALPPPQARRWWIAIAAVSGSKLRSRACCRP